ncbi:MAG: AMIN domain-containing protein [Sulfurimonas sp.]|uniref:AMIN domain-containing protein n=1 Tax=Sulfurimonas sp. TaxID=2022749 RepID=UPI00260642AF|nr:AMIN domain-containing protein [Sulfurimonas sp.]MDD2653215.1 AMIN domain-containing protein [Sulfurimonas sp.]MDD3452540.1 AMIN domain-containing protein [Sulfurimonas sp.]
MKVLSLFALLILTLYARENPFFPPEGEKDIFITSNKDSSKAPLKQAAITLPSQARVLQKVTVELKNLDGSVETKSIEMDNSIDWHLPIFISQGYRETTVPVSKEKEPPKAATTAPAPIKKSDAQNSVESKSITSLSFVKFSAAGKSLKLTAKNEAIRNFLIANPHRIVVDFKSDTEVSNFVKEDFDKVFQKIRIGSHEGYYRIVVELDGFYKYEFKKVADGYLIELK